MRCLACGAGMRLNEEAGDETLALSGFKRQTFQCSVCGDIEQRLAFCRDVEPDGQDEVPAQSEAPSGPGTSLAPEIPLPSELPLDSSASAAEHEDAAAWKLAKRVVSKFARVSRAVMSRVSLGVSFRAPLPDRAAAVASAASSQPPFELTLAPAPTALTELVAASTGAPGPVLREIDFDIEECENLLRRAIKLVHAPPAVGQSVAAQDTQSAPQESFFLGGPGDAAIPPALVEPDTGPVSVAPPTSEAESPAPQSVPKCGLGTPAVVAANSETDFAAATAARSTEPGSAAIAMGPSEVEAAAAPLSPEPGSGTPALAAANSETDSAAATAATSVVEPRAAAAAKTTSHSEAERTDASSAETEASGPPIASTPPIAPAKPTILAVFGSVAPTIAPPAAALATGPSGADETAPTLATGLREAGAADSTRPASTSSPEPVAPARKLSFGSAEASTPAELTPRAEKSAAPRVVVQIQYDPVKGKYVATDIKTGLRILRHHDSAWLRQVCNRMNLQVVEGEVATAGYGGQGPPKPPGASQVR
jgi:hypothetical protein